jgi:hypothetical protein
MQSRPDSRHAALPRDQVRPSRSRPPYSLWHNQDPPDTDFNNSLRSTFCASLSLSDQLPRERKPMRPWWASQDLKEYSVSVTPFSLNFLPPLQLRFPRFFYRCIERNLLLCTRIATSTQRIQPEKLERERLREERERRGGTRNTRRGPDVRRGLPLQQFERCRTSASIPDHRQLGAGQTLGHGSQQPWALPDVSVSPGTRQRQPRDQTVVSLKTGPHRPRDQTAVSLSTRPSSDSVPDLHEPWFQTVLFIASEYYTGLLLAGISHHLRIIVRRHSQRLHVLSF